MKLSDKYISAMKDLINNTDLHLSNVGLYVTLDILVDYYSRYQAAVTELAGIDPRIAELEKQYGPLQKAMDEAMLAFATCKGDQVEKNRLRQELAFAASDSYMCSHQINLLKGRKNALEPMLSILEKSIMEKADEVREQVSIYGNDIAKAFPDTAASIDLVKQLEFEDPAPSQKDGGDGSSEPGEE